MMLKPMPYGIAITVLGTLILVMACSMVVFALACGDPEKAGQLGDSFGFMNALVSALALGAASTAIFIQWTDGRQRGFENHFMNMLEVLRKARDRVKPPPLQDPNNDGGFAFYLNKVDKSFEQWSPLASAVEELRKAQEEGREKRGLESIHEEYIKRVVKQFEEQEFEKFGPYFRTLFSLLDYCGSNEKIQGRLLIFPYTNLLRAELTQSELVLSALIALIPANSKYKTLMERYGFLKYIRPVENSKLSYYLIQSYSENAFKDNEEDVADFIEKANSQNKLRSQ